MQRRRKKKRKKEWINHVIEKSFARLHAWTHGAIYLPAAFVPARRSNNARRKKIAKRRFLSSLVPRGYFFTKPRGSVFYRRHQADICRRVARRQTRADIARILPIKRRGTRLILREKIPSKKIEKSDERNSVSKTIERDFIWSDNEDWYFIFVISLSVSNRGRVWK